MEPRPPRRKHRLPRRWRVILIVLLLLAGVFGGWRLAARYQLGQALEALRAQGQPISGEDLNAWYGPAAGADAAPLVAQAAAHLVMPVWRYRDLPLIGPYDWPPRDQPFPPAMTLLMRELVGRNQEALRLFDQAAGRGMARYPADLSLGAAIDLPHLPHLRDATRLLGLQAVLAAEQADPQAATHALATTLRLAGTLEREPVLLSYLVQTAMVSTSYYSLEQVASRASLPRAAWEELIDLFHQRAQRQTVLRAVIGERAVIWHTFNDIASVSPDRREAARVQQFYDLSGLHDQDRLAYLESMQAMVTALHDLPPDQLMPRLRTIMGDVYRLPARRWLTRLLMPPVDQVGELYVQSVAMARIVPVAAALDRYHADHAADGPAGPASLTALVPDYLPAIPADPFDGQPLRYRPLDNGYLIYSIGHDLIDDGGIEADAVGRRRFGTDLTFTVRRR